MWKTIKNQVWRWRGVLVVVPAITAALIGLRSANLLQAAELSILDLFFELRPAEPRDSRVVVVEVNDADIAKHGYTISDKTLAMVLNRLKQQQPRLIGLNLYPEFSDSVGTKELLSIFQSTPNLIRVTFVGTKAKSFVNEPAEHFKQTQFSGDNFVLDNDGKVRRNLLLFHSQGGKAGSTLGAKLALLYLQADNIHLERHPDHSGKYQLGQAVLQPLSRREGEYVRADMEGFQLLANFRNLRAGFRTVSLTEVVENRIPPDFARDRLVLIGYNFQGDTENLMTPYSSDWLETPLIEQTSRVVLHADVASQLLSAALEGRPLLRVWPVWQQWLWILGWSVAGAILVWAGRYSRTLNGATSLSTRDHMSQFLSRRLVHRLGLLGLGVGLVGGSYGLFLRGDWVPVVPGMLAFVGSAIATRVYIAGSVDSMRQMMSRYLTDQVVGSLLETPDGLNIGGERRIVTVLMSDLRGFSALSASLTPEMALTTLNRYLEVMVDVITHYGGTINEILGDGIFVIFGAPLQAEDDPDRAVACAIAMQQALQDLNQRHAASHLPPLQMGIGIHTGDVLAGNIGSQKRAKYAVVGKNVNLTSRIESLTVGGQVFISQNTRDSLGDRVQVSSPEVVHLKGFVEPVTVYEVYGMTGTYTLTLPQSPDDWIALPAAVPVTYAILEDKQMTETEWRGHLVKLSQQAAILQTDQALDPHQNLKMRLFCEALTLENGDVYAKVRERVAEQPPSAVVHFTYVPTEVQTVFDRWLDASSHASEGNRRPE